MQNAKCTIGSSPCLYKNFYVSLSDNAKLNNTHYYMADEKIIFSMVGVSKVLNNNKKILNNIYLSFFYGAKIGIIGLNGSGKSTLMKIIAAIFCVPSSFLE